MNETNYKQTEVGIIPADWDVTSIENTCNCYAGATPSTSNPNYWVGGNIPWMSSGEVNYRRIYTTECHITKLGFDNSSTKWVPKHSVVMALAGQGKTRGMVAINEIELCTNQSLCAIVPQSHLNYLYLYYNLYSRYNELREISGDARSGLNLFLIKNIHIPLPSYEEQKCIAQSLSDMDALLVSLDKLIAKKKAIKQGLMQELLTGKKRLNGFESAWVNVRLKDIALDIKTGKRNGNENVENGKYPFFVRSEQIYKINEFSQDCEAILVPGEGGIGKIFHYINGKFDYHQRVYKISSFKKADAKFVYYYMQRFFGAHASHNNSKATVDSLRLEAFTEFPLFLPSSVKEQKAIAHILSDMDDEIAELESKKAKYTAIKQGMMQQLLTGKIRLI